MPTTLNVTPNLPTDHLTDVRFGHSKAVRPGRYRFGGGPDRGSDITHDIIGEFGFVVGFAPHKGLGVQTRPVPVSRWASPEFVTPPRLFRSGGAPPPRVESSPVAVALCVAALVVAVGHVVFGCAEEEVTGVAAQLVVAPVQNVEFPRANPGTQSVRKPVGSAGPRSSVGEPPVTLAATLSGTARPQPAIASGTVAGRFIDVRPEPSDLTRCEVGDRDAVFGHECLPLSNRVSDYTRLRSLGGVPSQL
jgi:hypothetical protein